MPLYATKDGTKLYYEDTGKGPTLVFCHGLNSSHLAIRNFIDEFRGDFRCICYDQRGHACSDRSGIHINVHTLGQDPLTMASLWYSLFRTDMRPTIDKIDIPFLYVQPETPLYGDETLAFYRAHLKGGFRLETGFPGTTHMILLEKPKEVADRIKPFLRGEV